jgi:hypothetical protein
MPLSNDTIDSLLRHREVGRAKDLSASPRKRAFRVQKRVIQIFGGANKCKSCRKIFKDYRILTVTSLYILEELCYTKCIKVI